MSSALSSFRVGGRQFCHRRVDAHYKTAAFQTTWPGRSLGTRQSQSLTFPLLLALVRDRHHFLFLAILVSYIVNSIVFLSVMGTPMSIQFAQTLPRGRMIPVC